MQLGLCHHLIPAVISKSLTYKRKMHGLCTVTVLREVFPNSFLGYVFYSIETLKLYLWRNTGHNNNHCSLTQLEGVSPLGHYSTLKHKILSNVTIFCLVQDPMHHSHLLIWHYIISPLQTKYPCRGSYSGIPNHIVCISLGCF